MVISTGSLYCRKDGLWCAALQVHGKRKIVYSRTEQGARRRLTELQRQLVMTGRLPDPGRRTVSDGRGLARMRVSAPLVEAEPHSALSVRVLDHGSLACASKDATLKVVKPLVFFPAEPLPGTRLALGGEHRNRLLYALLRLTL